MRNDDSTLPDQSQRTVSKYADLLLRKADAYGRFPAPVDDLVQAAKLEIARESALAKFGVAGFYRRLPNSIKLAPDIIKRAASKVLGLLHVPDRMIHLDPDAHPKRQMYVTVHEIGHEFLPHQRNVFQILEDSDTELNPDTNELFEREANCFASDVLFQLDAFTLEAADFELGIKVPVDLSKKYGPSVYASARRYVARHEKSCALLVFDQIQDGSGTGALELRRTVASASFERQFGKPQWGATSSSGNFFVRHLPRHKFTLPTPLKIRDSSGDMTLCMAEAFDTTFHILFLVYPIANRGTMIAI